MTKISVWQGLKVISVLPVIMMQKTTIQLYQTYRLPPWCSLCYYQNLRRHREGKIWVAGKMGTENSHFCHFFFLQFLYPFPNDGIFGWHPVYYDIYLKKKRNRVKTLSKFYYGFFLQKLLAVKSRWLFSKQSCIFGDWQGAKSPLPIP